MFKITEEMLDSARTKNGSFTNAQVRIMMSIFTKDWKNKLLDCDDFCPDVWERFKAANITANEARRVKASKRKVSKINSIESSIERSQDSKLKAKTSTETISDLKNQAGYNVLEIYKTVPRGVLRVMPDAIKEAWLTGEKIDTALKLLNRG